MSAADAKNSPQRLTDERLRRMVSQRLHSDDQIEADDIDVIFDQRPLALPVSVTFPSLTQFSG